MKTIDTKKTSRIIIERLKSGYQKMIGLTDGNDFWYDIVTKTQYYLIDLINDGYVVVDSKVSTSVSCTSTNAIYCIDHTILILEKEIEQ